MSHRTAWKQHGCMTRAKKAARRRNRRWASGGVLTVGQIQAVSRHFEDMAAKIRPVLIGIVESAAAMMAQHDFKNYIDAMNRMAPEQREALMDGLMGAPATRKTKDGAFVHTWSSQPLSDFTIEPISFRDSGQPGRTERPRVRHTYRTDS